EHVPRLDVLVVVHVDFDDVSRDPRTHGVEMRIHLSIVGRLVAGEVAPEEETSGYHEQGPDNERGCEQCPSHAAPRDGPSRGLVSPSGVRSRRRVGRRRFVRDRRRTRTIFVSHDSAPYGCPARYWPYLVCATPIARASCSFARLWV